MHKATHKHQTVHSSGRGNRLNVVSVISNPVGYESRYALFKNFQQHMQGFDVNLIVVELAHGHRSFVVTSADNPNHIQLRGQDEVWHKENMVNIGVSRLPQDWEYMAWVDGDISFLSPSWVHDTLHALQRHKIVQLFQDCIDMGPDGRVMATHRSFCFQAAESMPRGPGYSFWHPGFAWGIRRDAFNALGGLVDFAVLGSGDHHMAMALIGEVEKSVPGGIHPNYLEDLLVWQDRAKAGIGGDIGWVAGAIQHHWHGKKKDRRYIERWDVLTRNRFDPRVDIRKDWQGVIHLSGNKPKLRDDIRRYFRQRSEDSIDLE